MDTAEGEEDLAYYVVTQGGLQLHSSDSKKWTMPGSQCLQIIL
jgi:hypothetical protein